MNELALFGAFLITHFIMDVKFRWRWGTIEKVRLFSHCFVYTVGFIPAFLFFKVNFLWLLLIFFSHFFIDQGKLENWVLEKFKRFRREGDLKSFWDILDQALHLIILALVVIFS